MTDQIEMFDNRSNSKPHSDETVAKIKKMWLESWHSEDIAYVAKVSVSIVYRIGKELGRRDIVYPRKFGVIASKKKSIKAIKRRIEVAHDLWLEGKTLKQIAHSTGLNMQSVKIHVSTFENEVESTKDQVKQMSIDIETPHYPPYGYGGPNAYKDHETEISKAIRNAQVYMIPPCSVSTLITDTQIHT